MSNASTVSATHTLFSLLSAPREDAPEPREAPRHVRALAAAIAILASIGCAALWGLAANATGVSSALANAVKVPMLLIVSAIAAMPPVLVFARFSGLGRAKASDIAIGYGAAMFAGTLVLAVLAPIVALYQHSSTWAGPYVAMGSAVVAFISAVLLFVRVVGRLTAPEASRAPIVAPAILMMVVQLAVLSQLASVVSPIFDRRTPFGKGIDAVQHSSEVEVPQ
jgi:Kef-type K+ transport system membrane component KefB